MFKLKENSRERERESHMDYVGYAAPHSTIHLLLLNKFVTESSLTKMGSYAYPYAQIQYHAMNPVCVVSSLLNDDCNFRRNPRTNLPLIRNGNRICKRKRTVVCEGILFPLDVEVDSPAIASAFSLIPYVGFLYFITKSKSTPRLTLFGFYFLLAFVAASSKSFLFLLVGFHDSINKCYEIVV